MKWKERKLPKSLSAEVYAWNEYEKTTEKLREEFRRIYNLFPRIRDLFNIEKLCKTVGCSDELTQKILTINPVSFKGKLFSTEHMRKFETDYSVVKIEKDSAEPSWLRLFIDNFEINEWFKKIWRVSKKLRNWS